MAINTTLPSLARWTLFLGATALAAPMLRAQALPPEAGARPTRATTGQTAPGGSVLYSQNILEHDGNGDALAITATLFLDPGYSTLSSEGADDFHVADASGWTIDQITAAGNIPWTNVPAGSDGDAGPFNVTIYADAGGQPSATAACRYDALPYTRGAILATAWTAFGITLPTPCRLEQGTYWLSIVASPPPPYDNWDQWLWRTVHVDPLTHGYPPMLRNPEGGRYPNCPAWDTLANCDNTSANALVFQIIGSVNAETAPPESGITLTVGLAEYDGDPAQCASATDVQASVGDQINACYTVTNHTSETLNYQTLADASGGPASFINANVRIEPGESYRYHRIFPATRSTTLNPVWTAQTVLPPYLPTATADAFVDVAASGTELDFPPMTQQVNLALPFAFAFYGRSYSGICVNQYGLIAFLATASDGCGAALGGEPLPFAHGFGATVEAALMPWWDYFASAGSTHVATLGTAPTLQFVVQWTDKNHVDPEYNDLGDPGRVTFQAILNEADGTFDYRYRTVEFGTQNGVHDFGRSATIGLQAGQTGPSNYQYSWGAPVLSDGLALHWTPGESVAFTASHSATLEVGAPSMALGQTALAASAAAGGSAVATLDLRNDGDRALEWTSAGMSAGPQHHPIPPPDPALQPRRSASGGLPLRTASAGVTRPAKAADAPLTPLRYRPPVAAFGMAFSVWFPYELNSYARLDASFPGMLEYLGLSSRNYFAGTFANYDFSTAYVVDAYSGDLLAVDTGDGSERLIGSIGLLPSSGLVTGMRWDPSSGTTYLMAGNMNCASSSAHSTLYTIDLASGAMRTVGTAAGVGLIDIAIDPAGTLWSVDVCSRNTVVVDKASGQVSRTVGLLGLNVTSAAGMDFDASSDTLYFAAIDNDSVDPATGAFESRMYTIDLQSGQATPLDDGYGGFIGPKISQSGGILNGVQLDALAIAAAPGPCALQNRVSWLGQSPSEGTLPSGATQAITVTFDATGLAPGIHTGNVCLDSNDPDRRQVAVPVTFTVTGDPDVIFRDGFDP